MKQTVEQPAKNAPEILAHRAYLRARTNPGPADLFYLSLSDLKRQVERSAKRFNGSVLDYGCGGSPYRSLFAQCNEYTRADMLAGPEVDVVLTCDGKTGEPSGAYQGVVSFQVLEHVADPGAYLEECHRILAPNGLLLLTTHGMYLEHKCPDDFYRWTSQGLDQLVTSHGFVIVESTKLTVGLRGVIQLMHYFVEDFVHRRGTMGAWLLRGFRRVYGRTLRPVLNVFGKVFLDSEAMVTGNNNANVYVGVAVLARKV